MPWSATAAGMVDAEAHAPGIEISKVEFELDLLGLKYLLAHSLFSF
jgi:hypothetical protein